MFLCKAAGAFSSFSVPGKGSAKAKVLVAPGPSGKCATSSATKENQMPVTVASVDDQLLDDRQGPPGAPTSRAGFTSLPSTVTWILQPIQVKSTV